MQVLSDIFAATDRQDFTLLCLLDVSVFFCVAYSNCSSSMGWHLPAWLQSFLDGRCQQICYEGQLSAIVELVFGVPQSSVMGPLLLLLYSVHH